MKRALYLFSAVTVSIVLFCAFAILFVGGPLGDVSQGTKLCALAACGYLSAVVCKVAAS